MMAILINAFDVFITGVIFGAGLLTVFYIASRLESKKPEHTGADQGG